MASAVTERWVALAWLGEMILGQATLLGQTRAVAKSHKTD
jgi:hypothetical protein